MSEEKKVVVLIKNVKLSELKGLCKYVKEMRKEKVGF